MPHYVFDQIVSGGLMSDVTADVTLGGLQDINVDSGVDAKVATDSKVDAKLDTKLASDSKVDSKLASDSKVDTKSSVDLAPVAVDSCVRVELGALPPTEVSTPWEQRFGLCFLGYELVAWTMSGRTTTTLRPVTPQPQLIGSVEQAVGGRHSGSGHERSSHRDERGGADRVVPAGASRGLEIRLG